MEDSFEKQSKKNNIDIKNSSFVNDNGLLSYSNNNNGRINA